MSELYNVLMELCQQRGVSAYRMCKDVGIQPSVVTDLKKGRRSSVRMETAVRIAEYFGVPVEALTGNGQTKKPSAEAESLNRKNLKFAVFGEPDVDDALMDDVLSYAKYKLEQQKKGK